MKKRLLVLGTLVPSAGVYFFQTFAFTTTAEQLVCGTFGVLWFVFIARGTSSSAVLLGLIAAVGLGFSPHRLRLPVEPGLFAILVPLLHFLATAIAVRIGQRGAKPATNAET